MLIQRRVPPNCVFEIDDYESDWAYKNKFDYIHGRELIGCIGDEDRLFRQAFEHLKPGGYFELQSVESYFGSDDGTHEKAEFCQMWLHNLREAGDKFGKSFRNVPRWKEMMEKAGFVDVQDVVFKVCPPAPSNNLYRSVCGPG